MSPSHDFSARTASEFFGEMSETYDSLIQRSVPRDQEMLRCTLEFCPDEVTRVLELGCGTGNRQGHSWHIHLPTGQTAEMQLLPMNPAPIIARFDLTRHLALFGNPSGSIRIESIEPGLGHTIVHDSLAHRVLVHANSTHTLSGHCFRTRDPE